MIVAADWPVSYTHLDVYKRQVLMKIPESKLPFAGTNIFTKMSGLAFEVGAYNIAQGFPDFPCDPRLISLVDEAMKKGWNQYAPMPGVLKLREKIAEKTFELYRRQYDPMTEVTVMPVSYTHLLFLYS